MADEYVPKYQIGNRVIAHLPALAEPNDIYDKDSQFVKREWVWGPPRYVGPALVVRHCFWAENELAEYGVLFDTEERVRYISAKDIKGLA